MEKDTVPTDFVFRKFKDGEIIALMPHDAEYKYNVNSYMHIGQHGTADYNGMVAITKLATEDEYKDLKQELENIGYLVNVIKKQNRDKFLKSYRELINRLK